MLALVATVFLCAAGTGSLKAQSGEATATVTGTVLDVAAKPIASAAVSVSNESAGAPKMVVTDADGHYSLIGLPEGLW